MQAVIEGAPRLFDDLDEDSLRHFEELQAILRSLGHRVRDQPALVRGLDYYNHTVFEWVTDRLGAQAAVCAGGRYDGLIRAARRQAGAGLRLRHGGGAVAGADGGGRHGRAARRSGRLSRAQPGVEAIGLAGGRAVARSAG